MKDYPKVFDEGKVGKYPALAKAGGGYVWDEVLEYRVWCHPERGAEDLEDGNDYYYVFTSYKEAKEYAKNNIGTEEPLALILQREFIDEPETGNYIHKKEERITEWPVEFLSRPRRNESTIPNFLSPNAPLNRLDILRGTDKTNKLKMQNIYISEVNESKDFGIVVEGDEHSIWAYFLEIEGDEHKVLFDGFICSRGTVLDSTNEVKNYLKQGKSPPLAKDYLSEYSVHKDVTNEDFEIQWLKNEIHISMKNEVYLIMNIDEKKSYSKSISRTGPYGHTLDEYKEEN